MHAFAHPKHGQNEPKNFTANKIQMRSEMGQIKKIRHTRITVSSTERLTVWRFPKQNKAEQIPETVSLKCPYCGAKAFWFEVEQGPDIELYEETTKDE